MLNLKTAYEILGVKEDASKDEILKRYNILLKKHQLSKLEGQTGDNEKVDLDEINKVYDFLMGYNSNQTDEANAIENKKLNPIMKKLNLDPKKVDNFFYYHKVHIIVSILIVAMSAFFIKDIVTRVKPDLRVAFVGSIHCENRDTLKTNIKEKIVEAKEINLDFMEISDDKNSQQDIATLQKIGIIMAAGQFDIFILDKSYFEEYANLGAFLKLDDLVSEFNIDKSKYYKLKIDNEQTEAVYGIDVSSSSLLNNSGVTGNVKIVAFKEKTKYYKNAVKFLELLIK